MIARSPQLKRRFLKFFLYSARHRPLHSKNFHKTIILAFEANKKINSFSDFSILPNTVPYLDFWKILDTNFQHFFMDFEKSKNRKILFFSTWSMYHIHAHVFCLKRSVPLWKKNLCISRSRISEVMILYPNFCHPLSS